MRPTSRGSDLDVDVDPGGVVDERHRHRIVRVVGLDDPRWREREQPTAEHHDDDPDRRLGAERAPEAVGERNRHLLRAGEARRHHLASRDGDEHHDRDDDGLQQQHPPVAAAEQRTAVETDELDDAGDDGAEDRRQRDAAEAAHRLHQVVVAWPGQHDTGDERHATHPHRRRQRMTDAGEHTDRGEVAARPTQPDGHDGEQRDAERGQLRGRVDDPLGSHHHPAGGDDEDEAGDRRPPRPAGIGEVEPRRRAERGAEGSVGRVGGERHEEQHGPDQRQRPHRAQEPHGDHVLGPLGPGDADQHERAEDDHDAERRQHSAEPLGAAGAALVVVVRDPRGHRHGRLGRCLGSCFGLRRTGGSFWTENAKRPSVIVWSSSSRRTHATLHPPRGSGVRISTVTMRSSLSPIWGTPVFCGWVSHETGAVSLWSAPSSRVNVNTSSAGDALSVSPSAGDDASSTSSRLRPARRRPAPRRARVRSPRPRRAEAATEHRFEPSPPTTVARGGSTSLPSALPTGRPARGPALTHPLGRLGHDGHPVAVPPLPATSLQRAQGAGPCRARPSRRGRERPRRPGVPVLRTAWHGQDLVGAHPRQGAQLRATGRRRAVLRVRVVPRRRARHQLRRPRARRRQQQRGRCDP